MYLVTQGKKDRARPRSRIISASPRRQQIKEGCPQEVESLRELREIAGKAQIDVATVLRIKQPSVSKMEKQADMYLSTLRAYIEAIGGELELVVRLPQLPVLRLYRLGDALGRPWRSRERGARARRRRTVTS
jgi:hypothetical protein